MCSGGYGSFREHSRERCDSGGGYYRHGTHPVKTGSYVKEAGTYAIRPCIGGNGDGSKTLSVSIDYGEEVVKSFGAISAWNAPVLADDDVYRVELTAGLHNIDLIRNGNWFNLDYLVLEMIEE